MLPSRLRVATPRVISQLRCTAKNAVSQIRLMPVGVKRHPPLLLSSRLRAPEARVISQICSVAKSAMSHLCLMPVASRRAPFAFVTSRLRVATPRVISQLRCTAKNAVSCPHGCGYAVVATGSGDHRLPSSKCLMPVGVKRHPPLLYVTFQSASRMAKIQVENALGCL
jgi:hypothetical protein